MKKILSFIIALLAVLPFTASAAFPPSQVGQGGTGTTSFSGYPIVGNGANALFGSTTLWLLGVNATSTQQDSTFARFSAVNGTTTNSTSTNIFTAFETVTTGTTTANAYFNGNIGISSTSPNSPLSISRAGTASLDAVYLTNNQGGANDKVNIHLSDGGGTGGTVGYERQNSASGDLTFDTSSTFSGSLLEAMRITAVGNVGISTTTPQSKLDVNGLLTLETTNGAVGGIHDQLGMSSSANNLITGDAAGDLDVITNGRKMNFSNDNGTTNMLTLLAAGALQIANGSYLQSSSGTTGQSIQLNDSSGDLIIRSTTAGIHLRASNAGADDVTILTSGRVGVASTTPSAQFAVQGNAAISGNLLVANMTATGTASTTNFMATTGTTTNATSTTSFATTASSTNLFAQNFSAQIKSYPSFTYATSTTWTATTTFPIGTAYVAELWNGIQCFTDTGTLNVDVYHTTTHMALLNASTTVGTFTWSANNSLAPAEERFVAVGTPSGNPTTISCTVSRSTLSN